MEHLCEGLSSTAENTQYCGGIPSILWRVFDNIGRYQKGIPSQYWTPSTVECTLHNIVQMFAWVIMIEIIFYNFSLFFIPRFCCSKCRCGENSTRRESGDDCEFSVSYSLLEIVVVYILWKYLFSFACIFVCYMNLLISSFEMLQSIDLMFLFFFI